MCNDPSIQLQRIEKKHFEPRSISNRKSSLKKKLLDILKMQLSIKTHQVDPFDTLDDDDDFQIVYFFQRIQTSLLFNMVNVLLPSTHLLLLKHKASLKNHILLQSSFLSLMK